jgi:hypothetical protein
MCRCVALKNTCTSRIGKENTKCGLKCGVPLIPSDWTGAKRLVGTVAYCQVQYIRCIKAWQPTQQYSVFKNKVDIVVSTVGFIDAIYFDPYTGSRHQAYDYISLICWIASNSSIRTFISLLRVFKCIKLILKLNLKYSDNKI